MASTSDVQVSVPVSNVPPRPSFDRATAVEAIRRSRDVERTRASLDHPVRISVDRSKPPSARRSIDVSVVATQIKQEIEVAQEAAKAQSSKTKKDEKLANLKKEIELTEHRESPETLYERFHTDPKTGLTKDEAKKRLESYGLNQLTPPPSTPEWIKFLRQMVTGFSLLLWAAAILCFIAYGLDPEGTDNLALGIALVVTIVLTGSFAYYQERQSGAVMEGFKKMIPTQATVVRDGARQNINAIHLVPGDIVEINIGQKIPADIRILSASNMKVDNSSLTGESEPLSRSAECTDENPMETKNIAFFTTQCVEGSGRALVIKTGDNTLIGRIAGLASSTSSDTSPIKQEINKFVIRISLIALIIGFVFFGVGFRLYAPVPNLIFGIGIIVANVPEGLVATVTVCLTHSARKMATKNVLVKNLEAVEALGSTSVICSDKTGTLTQNRMTVVHAYYNDAIHCCLDGFDKDVAMFDRQNAGFQALQRIATLCNKAEFEEGQDDTPISERNTLGDATESGLIKFLEPLSSIIPYRLDNSKIVEIPFNSKDKIQLSVHAIGRNPNDCLLVMKGAPERIVDRCSTVLINGEEVPLTDEWKARINENNEILGAKGERVLGFAHLHLDKSLYNSSYVFSTEGPEPNFPRTGLTFVGLISLIDPPRPTVPGAVAKCHRAGVKVIMVTGDHPITAKAIARQVGIISGETIEDVAKRLGITVEEAKAQGHKVDAIVVPGWEIPSFDEKRWHEVLDHNEIVFARTSPQQKLVIVEHNQERGNIVAVTGDGVNDSPALKKADIGVAMGISGSDVSRDAADMVLLDDNFASIVNGVEEGRLIFDNLKKSIAYTLEHLASEVVPFLVYFIWQVPLPLTTILILCIDLGTDLFPAISCAYEEAESDIMSRRPRNPKTDSLVGWRLFWFAYLQIGLIQVGGVLASYFYTLNSYGFPPSSLPGIAVDWMDPTKLVLGYDYDYRMVAMRETHAAVFLSIVIVQWSGLLICKTRKLSIFQQGLRNAAINWSLIAETFIAIFLIYVPVVNDGIGTYPLQGIHWAPPMPFAFLVFVYDETRKFLIRRYPGGIVERLTYY